VIVVITVLISVLFPGPVPQGSFIPWLFYLSSFDVFLHSHLLIM